MKSEKARRKNFSRLPENFVPENMNILTSFWLKREQKSIIFLKIQQNKMKVKLEQKIYLNYTNCSRQVEFY